MTLLDDDRLRTFLDAGIDPVGLDEILTRAARVGDTEPAGDDRDEVAAVVPAAEHLRGRWLFRAAAVVVVLAIVTGTAAFLLGRDGGDEQPAPDEVDTVEEVPAATASLLDDLLHTYEWRDLPAPPLAPREDAVSLWAGDRWVLWGGVIDGVGQSDGAVFDPVSEEWAAMSEAPIPGSSVAVAAVVDDRVVVVDGSSPALRTAAYDPKSDTWIEGGPSPIENPALSPYGSVVISGVVEVGTRAVVVVPAGTEAGDRSAWVRTALFDPRDGTWDPLVGPPPLASGDTASAVLALPTDSGVRLLARGTEPGPEGAPAIPLEPVPPSTMPPASEEFEPVEIPEGRRPGYNAPPREYAYFLDPEGRWMPLETRGDRELLPPGLYAQPGGAADQLFPPTLTPYGPAPAEVEDPAELAGTVAWPDFGHVVEEDGTSRLIPPGPLEPGDDVYVAEDLLLARSGGSVGGLGDAEHPPIWQPGEWGVYDPAEDRWHHLSGGEGVAGERLDIAPGGDRGNTRLATVWTGTELLSWLEPPFAGIEPPPELDIEIDDDPFATAYGPPPDRSGLDECEPDGDGTAGGPTTGDDPWQPVAGPDMREPAFAHPGALGGWLAAGARPGHAAALVDAECTLVGWWVNHRFGSLAAVTIEEYEALDFGWLAWQGEQARPLAGQVVDQLVLRDDEEGSPPGVYVIADPTWTEFDVGSRAAPSGYPRWRPAGEMASLGIAGLREGTIIGSASDAGGTYGEWAALELGDVVQGGLQGGDIYGPGGSPPRYDLVFTFEVVDVRTIPTEDVEVLTPDDPPGLRLVIEHDDDTATVVDTRRWTDDDRQREAEERQAQGYRDFDRQLSTGELDAATEIARYQEQIDLMQPVPGPEHDEAYHRYYAARLEELETYIEIAERYLDE